MRAARTVLSSVLLVMGLLGVARLSVPQPAGSMGRPASASDRIGTAASSLSRDPIRNRSAACSPSEAAAHEGWWWWIEAKKAVNEESEALALAAIGTPAGDDVEAWRRWQMARDQHGHLDRARAAARRAALRARTPKEAYEAALLLTRVECDAGRHQQELEQAYRLMRLAARDPLSLNALRRASRCNSIQLPAKSVTDLADNAPDPRSPALP